MTTWTLIVFIFLGYDSGVGTVKIEGYLNERACLEASQYATKNIDDRHSGWRYRTKIRSLCVPTTKGN